MAAPPIGEGTNNKQAHLPAAEPVSDNDKQVSIGKHITWPGQVQRRDTSHGLVGDGPDLSPSKLRSPVELVLGVDLSADACARQPRSGIRPAHRQGGMRCAHTRPNTYITAASICMPEPS